MKGLKESKWGVRMGTLLVQCLLYAEPKMENLQTLQIQYYLISKKLI